MSDDASSWTLERRASTARGDIAWDVFGEGPPVVLVHGSPGRSVLWRDVVPVLTERFAVYVLDLLGFGQSERSEKQALSIRLHAQVVADLVEIWGLDAPALVGHDIGGATVLRAHLLEATVVRGIALIDAVVLRPWITPTTRHLQAYIDVYRTMPTHIFREVAAAHLRSATYLPMEPAVFAAYFDQWEGAAGQQLWMRHVSGFDERDTAEFELLLDRVTVPVRIIWGAHDAWLDPQISTEIQDRLPTSDRILIPDAGHFSPEDQPAQVAQALVDFLA